MNEAYSKRTVSYSTSTDNSGLRQYTDIDTARRHIVRS